MEVLAGAFGGLAGILGFAPFFLLSNVFRKRFMKDGTKAFAFTLLIPFISFALMLVAVVICWLLAPRYLVIFAAVCVVVFLLTTGVFTVATARRNSK